MADAANRSHIAGMTLLGELLTVIGPVGVLGLWLFQQTELERNASELRKIAAARAVYQTYQSNNGLFNGLQEILGNNSEGSERTRSFQIYNYELGLAALEDALPEPDRRGIPPRVDAYSGDGFQTKLPLIQTRLEALQAKLSEREQSVRNAANNAQAWYFRLFVALSLLSIVGAVMKTVQKLRPGATQ